MKAFRALSSASLKELLRNPLTTFLSLVFPMTFSIMFFVMPDLRLSNGQTVSALEFGLPAVFLFCALTLGLSGTAAPMAVDRKDGVLRSLGMAPISKTVFLLAQLPVRIGVIVVELGMITLLAILTDSFHPGNTWHVALGLILVAACSLTLGLFLGARSDNPGLTGALAGFVSPGLLFLCGVFLPYRMMPGWVEAVGLALPFTYIADMLRAGLSGITPAYSLLTGVLVSLAWAVAMFVAAFMTFRWDGR